jgi:hypothetical protein
MRSLDLKSLVAAAKRPHGKGESDIDLAGSRSCMTACFLEKHQLRCLILEAGRLRPGSASLKLDASRCLLLLDSLPSHRLGNRARKTEKPVRDWSKFFTAPGSGSVRGRKRKIQLATLSALKSWVLLAYDVENVFQFSVLPVDMPK